MAEPSELSQRLQRSAPLAGDVGGLLFFAYWMNHSRGLGLPPLLAVLVELGTLVVVMTAVLGYQLAQGSSESAWVGWTGVTTIALGFSGSLSMLSAGIVLFGLSIVKCRVHPRLPGFLLMGGGTALLVALAFAPAFGRSYANASPVWGVVMGTALVAIAGALADLDALRRQQESPRVSVPSGDSPKHVH